MTTLAVVQGSSSTGNQEVTAPPPQSCKSKCTWASYWTPICSWCVVAFKHKIILQKIMIILLVLIQKNVKHRKSFKIRIIRMNATFRQLYNYLLLLNNKNFIANKALKTDGKDVTCSPMCAILVSQDEHESRLLVKDKYQPILMCRQWIRSFLVIMFHPKGGKLETVFPHLYLIEYWGTGNNFDIVVTLQYKKMTLTNQRGNYSPKTMWHFCHWLFQTNFGQSCGLWLVSPGMQLQTLCWSASSSKWRLLHQYECARRHWPWGHQMKAISADRGNTLNLICPNTVCQK